jgi:hypothetical protein
MYDLEMHQQLPIESASDRDPVGRRVAVDRQRKGKFVRFSGTGAFGGDERSWTSNLLLSGSRARSRDATEAGRSAFYRTSELADFLWQELHMPHCDLDKARCKAASHGKGKEISPTDGRWEGTWRKGA